MIIKHHDLEIYYLQRRIELLHIFNQFADEAFDDDSFDENNIHPKIKILEEQYSDVIDPEHLCETLKRIYPDNFFSIKSRNT